MIGIILSVQHFYSQTRPFEVFAGLCLAIFMNVQALFYGVLLAVIFNTLSGIWKYAIINGRFKLTAWGLKRTIEKIGGYGIALATFGILDVLIIQISNSQFIVTISMIVAGIIILYEGRSITDNLKEITGMNVFSLIYEGVNNAVKRRVLENDEKEGTKLTTTTTTTTTKTEEEK